MCQAIEATQALPICHFRTVKAFLPTAGISSNDVDVLLSIYVVPQHLQSRRRGRLSAFGPAPSQRPLVHEPTGHSALTHVIEVRQRKWRTDAIS